MTTIYKYSIWCLVEQKYVHVWSESQPTACPNDTSHSINPIITVIASKVPVPPVNIAVDNSGLYQSTSFIMDVLSTDTQKSMTISFPSDIYIWSSKFTSTPTMVGDTFSIIINPNTIIGTLTSVCNSGDNVLTITPEIFASGKLSRGMEIIVCDASDPTINNNMGRILDIDSVALTLTLEYPATHTFNIDSLVKLNVYVIKDQYIDVENKTFTYGVKGIWTKIFPKGQTMVVNYKNNNATTKKFVFDAEYNYA